MTKPTRRDSTPHASLPVRARGWLRRSWLKIAKGILIAVIVLAVVHGIATVILGRRYEAELNAIKARGEPVSMSDLGKMAGEPIPDTENAAVIYRKAFALLEKQPLRGEADKLFEILDNNQERTPALWAGAEGAAPKVMGVMQLIEEALARPECYFPIKWQDGLAANLSHYGKFRQVARVPSSLAILDARRGDTASALRRIELGLRLPEWIERDPSLISFLVRVALTKMPITAVRDVIDRCAMTEPQARSLYDALGAIDLAPQYRLAWLGERALGISVFDQTLRKGPRAMTDDLGEEERWYGSGYELRPVIYADATCYLRLAAKQLRELRVPYRLIDKRDLDAEALPKRLPPYAVLTKLLWPVTFGIRRSFDQCQAEINATRAALAVIAYKDHFGSYPESLNEVKKKIGWDLRQDPFSGKDLIYKRQGKGFIVYSIGPNLKDDSGVAPRQFSDIETRSDIVISRNR